MRSRLIFLCSVTLLYASCFSMEQKRGWKLSRGEGEWRLDPESGIRSLTVTGSGDKDESTYWTSEYPFEPGGLYRISCELRAPGGTGDGLALTGSNLVNMAIPAEPEWKAYAFIFTAPQEAGRPVLRFGQYRVRGTVWFRNIEVQAVTPFYRRSGGLALGTGERVQDGVYQAALTYKGTESNSSRCLHAAKGYFNSYRWDLRAGDYVVYCHHPVAGRPVQKSAEVAVNIGYHTGGVCVVEASRDLEQWREIGRIDGKRRSSFALPSGLFPACWRGCRFSNTSIARTCSRACPSWRAAPTICRSSSSPRSTAWRSNRSEPCRRASRSPLWCASPTAATGRARSRWLSIANAAAARAP